MSYFVSFCWLFVCTRAVPKVRGHDFIIMFHEYYSDKFFIL